MYQKIIVPVDLQHAEALEKALQTAADLGKHYDAEVCYVSVGSSFPTTGHNPHDFEERLSALAKAQADKHGLKATTHAIVSLDPAAELDSLLLKEIEASGADMVVMGSHQPGMAEYFISSNAGYLAAHAKITIMVVR